MTKNKLERGDAVLGSGVRRRPARNGEPQPAQPRSAGIPVLMVQAWTCGSAPDCEATLRLWGFQSASTSDLEGALRHMVEHECRALVIDLDMPRVDGLALVNALRSHEPTRHVAIIATTRSGDEALDDLARESGCDVVLTGSIDPDVLAAELEAAFAHPGRRCAVA